jgi:Bacterial Ig-like domain (group 2)
MNVRVLVGVCAIGALSLAACGDSEVPTGPTNAAVPAAPRILSVTVAGPISFFRRGQTTQMAAQASLSNGLIEDRSASATWQSDNSGVASVSSGGMVPVGNEGEATISATVEGTRGSLRVRVVHAPRTDDPPPGQRLPRPNEFGEVVRLFGDRPDLVARSCQPENGGTGTWEFMDELVRRLRLKDTRWGYNSRRGVPGDVARDEVAYHWGPGPDENSRDVYAWDTMGGHCGPNPSPAWIEVTDLGVLWASRGLF